jgi:hypothetical protein
MVAPEKKPEEPQDEPAKHFSPSFKYEIASLKRSREFTSIRGK